MLCGITWGETIGELLSEAVFAVPLLSPLIVKLLYLFGLYKLGGYCNRLLEATLANIEEDSLFLSFIESPGEIVF